jgi:hypothetical protein
MAAQMKGKYEQRIALDCKTRWNSTYLMLSTALKYQDVLERLSQRAPCQPSVDDWKFARGLCDRLNMSQPTSSSPRYATFFCQLGGGRVVIFQ